LITIVLTQKQIEEADRIGMLRQQSAVKERRPAHNNAPEDPEEALAMHVRGARGERAAKVFLDPVTWKAFVKKVRGVVELDDFIDAKAVRSRSHRLFVQLDDESRLAYLLINAERHPEYDLIGWAWGREIMLDRYKCEPRPKRPCYAVKPDDPILRDPLDLRLELRRRQVARDPRLHFCPCGKWGSFGVGQHRGEKQWRCLAHRFEEGMTS
jgi:hypothetical protein